MNRKRTIFCNHYRAPYQNETCALGIRYDSFKGKSFPCVQQARKPYDGSACDKCEMPTVEQLEAEDRAFEKRVQQIETARKAIVTFLGGPWKKGMRSEAGAIDCPVCEEAKSLRFSRAGYNGHIHAGCSTNGCVAWME